MIATATNSTTQATSEIRKLNFITDIGSMRWRLSRALLVGCRDVDGGLAVCDVRTAAPVRGPPGPGRRACGRGFGLGFVIPENDAPTLAARPRALVAMSERVVCPLPVPPLEDGVGGAMSGCEAGSPDGLLSGAAGPGDGAAGLVDGGPVDGVITGLGRVTATSDRFAGPVPNA